MIMETLVCMASAVWLEARSEGPQGMVAVADVILVRAHRRNQTPCEVVHDEDQFAQGEVNLEHMDPLDRTAYDLAWMSSAVKLSEAVVEGRVQGDPPTLLGYDLAWTSTGVQVPQGSMTWGADHFHTTAVYPSWAPKFYRVRQVGQHIFYDSTRNPDGSFK